MDVSGNIDISPALFRGRRNVTERSRFRMKVNGTERCNPNGTHLILVVLRTKELDRSTECFLGRGRRELNTAEICRIGSETTYELRASCLNASTKAHTSVSSDGNTRQRNAPNYCIRLMSDPGYSVIFRTTAL